MAAMTYSVVRYAADGHAGEQRDGEVIASGLTLAEAKRRADQGHGSWLPEDEDGDRGEIIGYHDSDAEDCGGYLVREDR